MNSVHFESARISVQYAISETLQSLAMPVLGGAAPATPPGNALRVMSTAGNAWIAFGAGAGAGPSVAGCIWLQPGAPKIITGAVSTGQGVVWADAGYPVPGQVGSLPPIVFGTGSRHVHFDAAKWLTIISVPVFSVIADRAGGQISLEFGTVSFGQV